MRKHILVLVAVLGLIPACVLLTACRPVRVIPVPPASLRAVAVIVTDGRGPVVGAEVRLDGVPRDVGATNADGYLLYPEVPKSLVASHLWVTAVGFEPLSQHLDLPGGNTDVRVMLTRVRPSAVRGRLEARGRRLTYADGSLFVWRGLTGFLLTEQVARGRTEEAEAFLAWAATSGFTVVRVLAMLPGGWPDGHALTPDDGLAALPRVLELAEAAGLYVQLTVLANTATLPDADLGAYVERAGQACAASVACAVLEVANEPYHATQRPDVHDPATLARWAQRVPHEVLVALGPSEGDESASHAGGDVVTVHLDRGRDPWNMVRRVRELERLSSETGKPVLNTEPIGFAEVARPGSRLADPALAYAFGVLSRVFTVPTTFHFESGLRAGTPGPNEQACAEAFVAGTHLLPDDARPVFKNAGWSDAAVATFRAAEGPPVLNAAVRAYSAVEGNTGITVLLGVLGEPGVEWANGWRPMALAGERPLVQVWTITR